MTLQQDRLAEDKETKLLDIAASSKVQIINAPIQLPGVCGLCGTSRTDDRQYIDIGLWVEFYGQWYFCTLCFTEFTNRLGGHTAEQAEAIENELDQARQTILDFQEKEAAIDGVVNTLRATGLFSGTDLTGITGDRPQDVPAIPEVATGDKSESTRSTKDSTKSSGKQRSDDLSTAGSSELDNWL